MTRQYVNLTDAQITALKARAEVNGSPISEEIRRAINLSLFADRQSERDKKAAE
jgi:hypothetical protein